MVIFKSYRIHLKITHGKFNILIGIYSAHSPQSSFAFWPFIRKSLSTSDLEYLVNMSQHKHFLRIVRLHIKKSSLHFDMLTCYYKTNTHVCLQVCVCVCKSCLVCHINHQMQHVNRSYDHFYRRYEHTCVRYCG